jgi:uncharacterized protein YciI
MQGNEPKGKPAKKYFVVKLIPPRPTFAEDMTEKESNIMKQQAAYWADKTNRGFVIVYGHVFDPKGGYGLGIIEVEDENQAHNLAENDPTVKTGLLRFEIYPMRARLPKK